MPSYHLLFIDKAQTPYNLFNCFDEFTKQAEHESWVMCESIMYL